MLAHLLMAPRFLRRTAMATVLLILQLVRALLANVVPAHQLDRLQHELLAVGADAVALGDVYVHRLHRIRWIGDFALSDGFPRNAR